MILGGKFFLCLVLGLGGDGPEEATVSVFQEINGSVWEGISFRFPELPANVAVNVLDIQFDSVENDSSSFHDIVADAVAREPCNLVLCHEMSLQMCFFLFSNPVKLMLGVDVPSLFK